MLGVIATIAKLAIVQWGGDVEAFKRALGAALTGRGA
jgi:hypothetical protein